MEICRISTKDFIGPSKIINLRRKKWSRELPIEEPTPTTPDLTNSDRSRPQVCDAPSNFIGGKVAVQYVTKKAAVPKPFLNKLQRLGGLHRLTAGANARISRTQRRVNRPYGGFITAGDLKDRIVRAFITEEIKEVKKKIQQANQPKKAKKTKDAAKKTTKKPAKN